MIQDSNQHYTYLVLSIAIVIIGKEIWTIENMKSEESLGFIQSLTSRFLLSHEFFSYNKMVENMNQNLNKGL